MTKLLVILICLFMSFGVVCVCGYDSDDSMAQYKAIEEKNRLEDIQYQLYEIRLELEQQRVRDQIDRLYDCDCVYDRY
jgi:hypothetical protein